MHRLHLKSQNIDFHRFITADSAFTANSANTFGGAVLLKGTARNIFIRCVFSAGPWLESEEGVSVLCTAGERRSPRYNMFLKQTCTQVYFFSVAASETFCRLSVGKNWAGEQGGAIEFKGSKPASLILEHVAFLRNIVSKADPAAQYKPVDVVISPSRPAKHNCSCSLGSARLPVLDCWFIHDALFTRPCQD